MQRQNEDTTRRAGWRGTGLNGVAGVGGHAPRDRRDAAPTLGLYEESRVRRGPEVPVRVSPHGWNTLWGAAVLGLSNTAERLLRAGANPDAADAQGRTALMYGAEWEHPDVLYTLLAWNADPNQGEPDGSTAVFHARGPKAERVLGVRRGGGANLDAANTRNLTALMEATRKGYLTRVQALLRAGADPNGHNRHGHTPLLHAALLKRTQAQTLLREYGARDGFGEAIASGEPERAEQLPTDVDLNAPLSPENEMLLERTARRGNFRGARLLLERGADPDGHIPHFGATPLDAAAEAGRGRIVRLLLDWGANPDKARTDTQTLHRWAGRTDA